MSFAASALIVIGSVFCFIAALGILRFPDVYTRLHAASKAGPLGAGLILLGTGLASGDAMTIVRCAIGWMFLTLCSPISAHLLARAALRSGTAPVADVTSINEFRADQ